jgi:2-dehydro-3-deoxyphosphogluconate aldolase/(4S)-4-hydroxy-2-oxoglutarate aldolase
VLNDRQLGKVLEAGSKFIVSPGLTEPLGRAVLQADLAYLPGVANAGDIMRGLDLGLDRFKFFPAETAGGIPALKALSAPFANVRFCPTGGVRPENARDWLALDSVLCVGGTWLVKPGDDLSIIGERARAARALG